MEKRNDKRPRRIGAPPFLTAAGDIPATNRGARADGAI
jgi:hypothetical protein